ncbi:MAG: rod shape-determining protein MreC [Pantoea sp. Brub]|nr:rod shape-determining protein MreC [Pantoea sp. Brub]
MKYSHRYKYFLEFNLVIAVFISTIIIVFSNDIYIFSAIRKYYDTTVSFICSSIRKPLQNINDLTNIIYTYRNLFLKNKSLQNELLLKNSELLTLEQYKKENIYLHKLLNIPVNPDYHKILTKVLYENITPYIEQLVIDKGQLHGVYVGQSIMNGKGIIGQVVHVNLFTSRVLLVCNNSHAIPVKVLRNNLRAIALGVGCNCNQDLKLDNLYGSDFRIGDILVTSGLDKRFPKDYPIGVITSVQFNKKEKFLTIYARSVVNILDLDYLLLLSLVNHK